MQEGRGWWGGEKRRKKGRAKSAQNSSAECLHKLGATLFRLLLPEALARQKATEQRTCNRCLPCSWARHRTCQKGTSGCRKRSAAKGVRSHFFVFGMLSVTFRSLFLMLLSLFSSLFCQTPFAGLLLRQGENILAKNALGT